MTFEWIYLSYLIHPNIPGYGGSQVFFDQPDKEMDKSDSCNSRLWRMSNHMGTHIDFPRHFTLNGNTLDNYPADFWIIKNVAILETGTIEPGHILTTKDIDMSTIPKKVEFLILKTGYCNLRENTVYWENNPGLHPELASVLHSEFPELRVVGFDLISLSSFSHRKLGRKAHKSFLDCDSPILLLEDMDLTNVDKDSIVRKATISPMRVKNADASPCTVFVEVQR